MLDGIYIIQINTLLGRKTGSVKLRTEGKTLFADIDAPVIGKQRLKGRADGDSFTARGTGQVSFVGQVEYDLKGRVSGDNLHIDIRSNKGAFKFEGVRA